jgi:hypothetical protein
MQVVENSIAMFSFDFCIDKTQTFLATTCYIATLRVAEATTGGAKGVSPGATSNVGSVN